MIIEAARQLGMEVVPEGGSLFEMNMTMIADGHTTIEHSLPVANIYDDVLQYWKGSGTAYTPTLVVAYGGPFGENYWYQHTKVWEEPILSRWVPRPLLDARARRPVHESRPRRIMSSTISPGRQAGQRPRHSGVDRRARPARGARRALGYLDVRAGRHEQSPGAAHRHHQSRPRARARQDLGSLEPGKLADLVILDNNPLDNIRNSTSVAMTMSGGRLLDRDLQVIAGGSPGSVTGMKPFWFHEQAGGAFTAGATVGVPHVD